jgi:multiple sugar transport system ATP-binding protein
MARVKLDSVNKWYGKTHIVKDLNLDIADGEFIVFLGPSGCGKSTTLRMIAGLEDISSGSVYIGNRLVNHVEAKDRNLAMVFQSYALYPHMSVYENISFALRIAGMSKSDIDAKVRNVAAMLELTELLNRKPSQLSGGQRQRVAMGRAMVRNPQLFLFDEPLSNLDTKLRAQMRDELKGIHQKLKTTTIYVTHDQIEAMTLADRIVIMRDGIVEQVGTPTDVFLHPANTFVAGFIGSPAMNFFDAIVSERDGNCFVESGSIRVPVPSRLRPRLKPGVPVTAGLRPSDIGLGESGPGKRALLQSQVVATEIHGSEVMIKAKAGENAFNFHVPLTQRPELGRTVQCSFDLDTLHLFDKQSGQSLASLL